MSAVSHELCIILEVGATLINYMHITDTYTRIESILPLKKNPNNCQSVHAHKKKSMDLNCVSCGALSILCLDMEPVLYNIILENWLEF